MSSRWEFSSTNPEKIFRNASRRQSATALYHDTKALSVKARFLGAKAAFFAHLEMPDGRVAAQLMHAEIMNLPLALPPAKSGAEVIDAEVIG